MQDPAVRKREWRARKAADEGRHINHHFDGDITIVFRPQAGTWKEHAACRGTDLNVFFPEQGETAQEAKKICARCTVTEQCLAYAIEAREKFGIWGGVAEKERRSLRRAA